MTQQQANADTTAKRLPCRGCTTSCKTYAICNGRPWRMDPKQVERLCKR